MKMARASDADIDAALAVSRILEDLEKRYMPEAPGEERQGIEWFDRDDAEQCQRALGILLDAAAKGSIFRVTFGMAVVLDPRNELLDPAADTLEKHPKTMAALAAVDAAQIAKGDARNRVYADSTSHLHVGDSSFEDWFQAHPKACTGDKQLARDAYAAGMGDPLVVARSVARSGEGGST
ncbi:hypothetical protein [Variovorax sp. PMC12]|uniref:hypothetical protein n=1 Tax=Variovorax sp. PMC12 TaxID=2126319 RepID=UPI000D13E32E|nr:hypothetical protein [Variovorax sp. PMC12]AVQ84253.1 hypothetical protein C4F17_26705 [Variovorax sp. PMC12]